jgi:hypothetical protein
VIDARIGLAWIRRLVVAALEVAALEVAALVAVGVGLPLAMGVLFDVATGPGWSVWSG